MSTSNASFGRSISPDTVRQLWAILDKLRVSKVPATLQNVISKSQQMFGWTVEEADARVKECIDAKLITGIREANQPECVYDLPDTGPKASEEPEHDWYCFECHGAGTVVPCTTCFRVYHSTCMPSAASNASTLVCSVCQTLLRVPSCDVTPHLNTILNGILPKYSSTFGSLPMVGGSVSKEQYRLLAAHHVDLNTIKNKISAGGYSNPKEFVADFQLLLHNVIIVYGKDSNVAQLAEDLLNQVKFETEGLENAATNYPLVSAASTPISPNQGKAVQGEAGTGKRERGKRKDDSAAESSRKRKRSDANMQFALVQNDKQVLAQSEEVLENQQLVKTEVYPTCDCDTKYKQLIVDLQQQWVMEYKQDREKCLTDLAEKLHRDFVSDQERLRSEMLTQFKQELETTKKDLDIRYAQQLKYEIQKLIDKHKKQISETKKKQWCWQCESEAIYHCCWNTAYCSVECQQEHWAQHRKYCRRKKQNT